VGLYIGLAVGGVPEVNQSDRRPSIRRSLPDLRIETPTSRDSFTLKMATATLAKTSGNLHTSKKKKTSLVYAAQLRKPIQCNFAPMFGHLYSCLLCFFSFTNFTKIYQNFPRFRRRTRLQIYRWNN
jgi:hypothetical protein